MARERNKYKSFTGFSKLDRCKRLQKLEEEGFICNDDSGLIQSNGLLDFSLADNFIENAIGYYSMPLGIAVNFVIDGKEMTIPMAIEETSVIAAASKTAKWIKTHGKIETQTLGKLAIGQVQISKLQDTKKFNNTLLHHKNELIDKANSNIAASMFKRGGGVKDLKIRNIKRPDGRVMGVVHILIETCDAMGANIINQICEFFKNPIEEITDEKVNLCILSNLNDKKLTRATITLDDIDPVLGNAIAEASLFAELDPYRAVTNNKGVLNAIDAVVIATGNDWRAVEAGIHAYAAAKGRYQSITKWTYQNAQLFGTLEVPISVGIVGGITNLHPMAQLCLKILNVNSAEKLARIIAAIGLVQNLGALRALTTEGITHGHLRLHINNFCCAVNATEKEKHLLKNALEKILVERKYITHNDARNILKVIREKKGNCND